MSNLLIVEAENDATFVKAVVKYLNDNNDNLFIDIDTQTGYKTLEFEDGDKKYKGLSETTLIKILERIKTLLQKEPIQKIGIILDQDNETKENRIKLVNDCIKDVFPEAEQITETNQLTTLTTIDEDIISIACYFINVDGQGELETLLRRIKHHDSPYADCLEDWEKCINDKEKKIKPKDFDKFWINIYLRYDTCKSKEKGKADEKCSFNTEGFKYVMENKSDIWNFKDSALDDLKVFLKLFLSAS
ncbi:MAG: DUF3226 domain-containing protein [Microcystaceae cyanobacterium]